MTLTTDAVVSAVPPAKAGGASAISETAYELGVALGVAVLGSLVTLGYQSRVALPDGLSPDAAAQAGDSLASAVTVAGDQGAAGAAVLEAAREAFVASLQTTCVVAAVLVAVAAVVAWRLIPNDR